MTRPPAEVDPLHRARVDAEWAVAARMVKAGRDPEAVPRRMLEAGCPREFAAAMAREMLELAYDAMEATVDATWPHAKRAYRPRTEARKMTETQTDTFTGWVILELMGHRRLAGWLSEQEIAGEGFLRLDIPADATTLESLQDRKATQFYRPAAVYCITPTTEEMARRVAKLGQPEPVRRWELPAPDDADDDEDPFS